jgi:4-hydroxy-3-methylbut-2-en-1-yl diphosphate reductase
MSGQQETGKRLLVARPRGFCAGVERAIATVEHLLGTTIGPLYVRKEIVHNRAVVDDFIRRGVIFVDELDEVPDGSTVIFSAHGVSPEVSADARRRGLRVVDATCPLVTKVHRQVTRKSAQGRHIILIGHEGHDEVVGTMGEAPGNITLITSEADIDRLDVPDETELYYVTQTTLSIDETNGIIERLKSIHPDIQGPTHSDICYATQNRQDAVKVLVELGIERLLVVGSPNSSNSKRLCEVARIAGVPADLVGGVADLPRDDLANVALLGLTAGASAPEYLVEEIINHFAAKGWEHEEYIIMKEDTKFDLPKELRS